MELTSEAKMVQSYKIAVAKMVQEWNKDDNE